MQISGITLVPLVIGFGIIGCRYEPGSTVQGPNLLLPCEEELAGCEDFRGTACPEETAQTPRDDYGAEVLALEYSRSAVAPQGLYDRISVDLDMIRTNHEEIAGIGVSPRAITSHLIVSLEEDAGDAFDAGEFTAWDCVNQLYRMQVVDRMISMPVFLMATDGRYYSPAIVGDFERVPGVEYASPNSLGGDGNDICVSVDGDTHHYIFDRGSGDCMAGCMDHTYWGFEITGTGALTFLGTFTEDDDPEPTWFTDLSECVQQL